jgi:hypothetical protein
MCDPSFMENEGPIIVDCEVEGVDRIMFASRGNVSIEFEYSHTLEECSVTLLSAITRDQFEEVKYQAGLGCSFPMPLGHRRVVGLPAIRDMRDALQAIIDVAEAFSPPEKAAI